MELFTADARTVQLLLCVIYLQRECHALIKIGIVCHSEIVISLYKSVCKYQLSDFPRFTRSHQGHCPVHWLSWTRTRLHQKTFTFLLNLYNFKLFIHFNFAYEGYRYLQNCEIREISKGSYLSMSWDPTTSNL